MSESTERIRRHFSDEQKAAFARRHLSDEVPVNQDSRLLATKRYVSSQLEKHSGRYVRYGFTSGHSIS